MKTRAPLAYKVGFLRKSRNLYDRYVESVKPWAPSLWYNWLGLRPGLTVVDVGCGTGHFTRFLARGLKGKGHVIGIDSRTVSIETAEKETKRSDVRKLVRYQQGDAVGLPFPDDTSDIAVCRTLLMHLREPLRAVREMKRIVKLGGTVAAVETDFQMRCYYNPRGEAHNALARRFSQAWVKGIAALDGKDYTIGSKLPTLFSEAGLTEIQANLDADPWLNCDARRPISDKLSEAKANMEGLRDFEETRRYLKAGGMSEREIDNHRKRSMENCERAIRNPEKLTSDTTFYAACWFIVTGRKRSLQ